MFLLNHNNLSGVDFESIHVDSRWNSGDETEHRMHRIHAYPAKFPAFIATKTLEYVKSENIKIKKMADIFCGCGTSALEARMQGIDFWGCDINPVATLIAKVKSHGPYQEKKLNAYFKAIKEEFTKASGTVVGISDIAKQRLEYWFDDEHYIALAKLKNAIDHCTLTDSPYRLFFYCAFSNILKATSKWLTKSIKPQIDLTKRPANVAKAFNAQVQDMIAASQQISKSRKCHITIETMNFLDPSKTVPDVDVIVTSPPYVTSYEYADIHQLSSLWLGYANDYRELREGSIGSLAQNFQFKEKLHLLNVTGRSIVDSLLCNIPEKARDITNYYLDMQTAVKRASQMLRNGGLAVFVIGNTEYKSVHINNAKHLSESFLNAGFTDVSVSKRKISKKILTPFRNEQGRFSTNKDGRKVYSEEFIIIGRKQQ